MNKVLRDGEFLAAIPELLRENMVDLHSLMVFEYAFPIDLAEEILTALTTGGFKVLGGDVWAVDSTIGNEPRPTGSNWIAPGDGTPQECLASLREFLDWSSRPDRYMTWVAVHPE